MQKGLILGILILGLMLFIAAPLSAVPDQEDAAGAQTPAGEESKTLLEENDKLTVEELYKKVKEQRDKLLESRLEVVKQANDAKSRIEDLIAKASDAKSQAKLADSLKKDLETIKEANKILNTILSDIVTATSESSDDESKDQPKVARYKAVTSAGSDKEALPSREYLNKLALLYKEKSFQLAKVIESLVNVGSEAVV